MLERYFPEGTWTGQHRAVGNVAAAGAFAGYELGNHPESDGVGVANVAIAERMARDHNGLDLPIFASRTIANHLYSLGYSRSEVTVLHGPSANGIHEQTGTYGEISQVAELAFSRGVDTIAQYSSGYNIGNIMRQSLIIARRFHEEGRNITFVVPPDLPAVLDPKSVGQPWSRGRVRWAVTTPLRMWLLRRNRH